MLAMKQKAKVKRARAYVVSPELFSAYKWASEKQSVEAKTASQDTQISRSRHILLHVEGVIQLNLRRQRLLIYGFFIFYLCLSLDFGFVNDVLLACPYMSP